jgi:hypothetical protein
VVNINAEMVAGKTPAEPPVTLVSVRVALLGDHPLSTRILDQIGYHLVPPGSSPPPGAGPPPGVVQRPATAEPARWSAPTPQPGPPAPPPETPPPPLLSGPVPAKH